MRPVFSASLLLRIGAAMTAIVLLTIVSIVTSLYVAEGNRGKAAAINQAGSLRMQSYKIVTRILNPASSQPELHADLTEAIATFEARIASPRLLAVLSRGTRNALLHSHEHILATWQHQVKPLLAQFSQTRPAAKEQAVATLLAQFDEFVQEIDEYVYALEQDAEEDIHLLRVIQTASLLLIVALVVATVHAVRTRVARPLFGLMASAERFRQGDFSARVDRCTEDELGRLGQAFNGMAEDLSIRYADLETRVAEQTRELNRTNASLRLLYNTMQKLNEAASNGAYSAILNDIARLIPVKSAAICARDPITNRAVKLACIGETNHHCADLTRDCEVCLSSTAIPSQKDSGLAQLQVLLRDQEHEYGVMVLEFDGVFEPEPWHMRLLETLGRHIGIALGAKRQVNERRLSVLEERAVIARELHDSLAQSLSYLKIQVTRLEAALNKPDETGSAVTSIVEALRSGLTEAYQQLRELLATFRAKMDERGLEPAVRDAIQEFQERNGITIRLHYSHRATLNANEEIHVLQITREALSNVARHSKAKNATVSLTQAGDGMVTVCIEDDGVGIVDAVREGHYGLAIMQERSNSLNGKLTISDRPSGGTKVELQFIPVTVRNYQTPTAELLT